MRELIRALVQFAVVQTLWSKPDCRGFRSSLGLRLEERVNGHVMREVVSGVVQVRQKALAFFARQERHFA